MKKCLLLHETPQKKLQVMNKKIAMRMLPLENLYGLSLQSNNSCNNPATNYKNKNKNGRTTNDDSINAERERETSEKAFIRESIPSLSLTNGLIELAGSFSPFEWFPVGSSVQEGGGVPKIPHVVVTLSRVIGQD